MTPDVRAALTPEVHANIVEAIGATADTVRLEGGFESFVYEWTRPDGVVFVKATWSGRRTREQIVAELQFVRHLAEAGVSVAAPVPMSGDLVRTVPAGDGAFHVSATRAAPGRRLAKDELETSHFEQLGALLAQLHAVGRQPEARALIEARPSWEDAHAALLPFATDPRIAARTRALLEELAGLPRDPDVFGLIHSDVHLGNVLWADARPTAFDFDDCLGFWYASDIAIVLYYTLSSAPGSAAAQAEFDHHRTALRRGYERVGALPDAAWQTVPRFMDLREAVLYLVVERSVPAESRTGAFAAAVQARRERLSAGVPALGLATSW